MKYPTVDSTNSEHAGRASTGDASTPRSGVSAPSTFSLRTTVAFLMAPHYFCSSYRNTIELSREASALRDKVMMLGNVAELHRKGGESGLCNEVAEMRRVVLALSDENVAQRVHMACVHRRPSGRRVSQTSMPSRARASTNAIVPYLVPRTITPHDMLSTPAREQLRASRSPFWPSVANGGCARALVQRGVPGTKLLSTSPTG